MANDRVFIKCKWCGAWKMLLKYFPSTGSTHRDNNVLEWLDTHAFCCPNSPGMDLGGDSGFTLHTEDGFVNGELDIDKQNSKGLLNG